MRTELIPILKKEVEKTFGRRIVSSRDCIYLSEEIFNKIGYKINSNTLRRFFGLVKSLYLPSHATLTMLAKYCGFNSVDELNELKINERNEEQIISQSSVLQLLVSLFREVETTGNDATCLTLVSQVVVFLNKNPHLADQLQREIAKTKLGQEYYFEQLVHIDKLNDYYGNGLRYYIKEKKMDDAVLFGYSLLVFRYWLTMDNNMMEKCFQFLIDYKPRKDVHPHLLGRYFSAQLFYAHGKGLATEKIVAEAEKVHASIKTEAENEQLFPYFEHLFSEALILTGHYEEGLVYVQYVSGKLDSIGKHINNDALQINYLLEAIAKNKLGMVTDLEQLLIKIRPDQFKLFSKKYCLMLYVNLMMKLKRREESYTVQLASLSEETGFKRLHNHSKVNDEIYGLSS